MKKNQLSWILVLCLLCTVLLPAADKKSTDDTTSADTAGAQGEAADSATIVAARVRMAQATETLVADLDKIEDQIKEYDHNIREAGASDKIIYIQLKWEKVLDYHAKTLALGNNILKRKELGDHDVDKQFKRFRRSLDSHYREVVSKISDHERYIERLRRRRDNTIESNLLDLENNITYEENRLQIAYRATIELIELQRGFDIIVGERLAEARAIIEKRAETVAQRVRHISDSLREMKAIYEVRHDDAALKEKIDIGEIEFKRETKLLSSTIALLNGQDIPTTKYQQLLVQVTGEISGHLLDVDVFTSLLSTWKDEFINTVSNRGPTWVAKGIFFLSIMILFRIIAAMIRFALKRALGSQHFRMTPLLRDTISSLVGRFIMLVGLMVALSQLGINVGTILAGMGIAGFVIGFALQETLANFAAGTMILLYRPFDVDDVIEAAGVTGKVAKMSLVNTTVLTFDNQTLIVPNTKIWGDVIRNVTAQDLRRVDLEIRTAYTTDVETIEALLLEQVSAHELTVSEPEPTIHLHRLEDHALTFVVRPWVKREDYWAVYWDLTKSIRNEMIQKGIDRPVPKQIMQMQEAKPT